MRVLIIDDNPLDIELVSRMLHKRLGAVVESVHTAEEGLRRLQVEFFDVVLLDYCLPGRNGLDFLREFQGRDISVPVLLVTARGDDNIQEIARQAGAVDYISKDEYLTPALHRAVIAAAEHGRAARANRERDRAEELRRNAEKIIAALEQRIEHLESAVGSRDGTLHQQTLGGLSDDKRKAVLDSLSIRYRDILKAWVGSPSESQRAREMLSELVADLFNLRFSAEQLVSLHTDTCHLLREEQWEGHPGRGCSPRMLLIEASLSLLDAYRRALGIGA